MQVTPERGLQDRPSGASPPGVGVSDSVAIPSIALPGSPDQNPPSQLVPASLPRAFSTVPDSVQELTAYMPDTSAESQIHPDLRSHLGDAPAADMMQSSAPPPPPSEPVGPMGPPATSPVQAADLGPDASEGSPDGRKAKRELSQSKRAAQNRAAQRAFRQRKEGYIKKLEQQVREYNDMDGRLKAMQSENFALREYVIHLTSKLKDANAELPPPPPSLNLSYPHIAPLPPMPLQAAPPAAPEPSLNNPATTDPLAQVAQAVANLGRADHLAGVAYPSEKSFKPDNPDEDRDMEEAPPQSRTDTLPAATM